MSLARYFVIGIDDLWLVTLEGRTMGLYPTRTAATDAAIVMADLMGAMHHDADVVVEIASGQPLELVWSYGRDEPPGARVKHFAESEVDIIPPHVRQVQTGEIAA
jgi:hypothetical protein